MSWRRTPLRATATGRCGAPLGLITKRDHSMAPAARTLFDMLAAALLKKPA
jgi:hypothetical protein